MLATLSLLGFLGLADFFDFGDKAKDFFYCSDSAFFVIREERATDGEQWYRLQGTAQTPQRGFAYQFQFVSVAPPHAYAVISAGQPVTGGRGLPALGTLQVDQKFRLPEKVGLLHLRLEGLAQNPREITCDLTPSKAD